MRRDCRTGAASVVTDCQQLALLNSKVVPLLKKYKVVKNVMETDA